MAAYDPRARAAQGNPAQRTQVFFTDRETESAAFAKALAAHRRRLDEDDGFADGARNVLVFHGVGGIGKTELSRRLQLWLGGDEKSKAAWGRVPVTAVDTTIRLDLHATKGSLDGAMFLLKLRAALANFGNANDWAAFDLVFAAYWHARRPGQEAQLDASPAAPRLFEYLKELAGALGLGTGVSLGLGLALPVIKQLRRQRHLQIARRFETLDHVLEHYADGRHEERTEAELLEELAGLLAYGLASLTQRITPLVVVFIDTFERLTSNDDHRREGEALLNRFIWSLPHLLFVITGRNALDWPDRSAEELPYVGRGNWPNLVRGIRTEPRQHLVGRLSTIDCKLVLDSAISSLGLAVESDIIDRIIEASGGLPQYLRIAYERAASILQAGDGPVTIEDVTGSLESLVSRLLEDLPAEEQQAIKAATLLPYFDSAVVAAAAEVKEAVAIRAATHSIFDEASGDFGHLRIHDSVRAAIRGADARSGGWTPADWSDASTRALHRVREQYQQSRSDDDFGATLQAVALAISIVCEVEGRLEPAQDEGYGDWLAHAIVSGPSISALRTLIPTVAQTVYGKQVINFIAGKSRALGIKDRQELLSDVFESNHVLSIPAGRHLAYMLRANERTDEAIAIFDRLIEHPPVQLHRYHRVFTMLRARRFSDAMAQSAELTPVRRKQIAMHMAWSHGSPEPYLEFRKEQLRTTLMNRGQREQIQNNGLYLHRQAFVTGDADFNELDHWLQKAIAAEQRGTVGSLLAGMLLQMPLSESDSGMFQSLLSDLRELGAGLSRYHLVRAAFAFAADDEASLRSQQVELNGRQKPRGRQWIPLECLFSSLGMPLIEQPTQWLEPYSEVESRWRNVFDAWKQRATRGSPSI